MPKKIISKQKVIQAAQSIAENGKSPTLSAVRLKLGNQGSLSTIHKYLKEWKENCFKQISNVGGSSKELTTVIEEKRTVEQLLRQQKLKNEQLSQELIQSEKALLQLKAESQDLEKANILLKNELKELSLQRDHLETLYQEIKAERKALYDRELAEKNRLIEGLQEELKMANQQAITKVREMGYERDDAVMQEKVKIINLQEKSLKLTEDNRILSIEIHKIKALDKQTAQKLEFYRKMIQACVPEEAREQYIQSVSLADLKEGFELP